MQTANIVYWYGQSDMPRDGGGHRALAWYSALQDLGYEASIIPLREVRTDGGKDSWLRRVKKQILPMPFAEKLPAMPPADLNIVTVPSVFGSAATTLPRETLIFDWMDRWSVNARTMGQSSLLSRPGSYMQSQLWANREKRLVASPAVNVYAGHEDKASSNTDSFSSFWIPTPISAKSQRQAARVPARIQRLGFIGNFNYPPNTLSLKDFLRRYGQELSAAGFEIVVGGFGSEIVSKWKFQATVLGRIESLAEFYDSIDAAIVPIEHGGGIKAKAVEAMAFGVPVFGTDHVAAGFSSVWDKYLGRVDDLMMDVVKTPLVVPTEVFSEHFSHEAFRNSVARVIDRLKARAETV